MADVDYKTCLIWLSTDDVVPPDGEEVLIADSLESDEFYLELDCGSTNSAGDFKWSDPDLRKAKAWMRPSFPCDQKETPIHERSLDDVRKGWLKSPQKKKKT